MVKPGIFRRRRSRTPTGGDSDSTQSLRPEGRMVSSPINQRLPALQEEAPDLRRVSRYSSVRSTFDSTTSASDMKATEKAFVVSRALSRNWMGVDDDEEDLTVSRVHPSASPFFRQWIEQQQHLQSPLASTREKSPPEASTQEASSVASTQVVLWKTWKFTVTLFLIGICLSGVLGSGLFCNLVPAFQFCQGVRLHKNLPELPFRDRYFKVVIHDESTGRFGSRFERGLMDAAHTLRVNVSIQRTRDLKETVLNIEEASCSLFDGLLVTLTEDPALHRSLQASKHRTSIITTGALESYSTKYGDGIGHLGEQEANVGKLAAEKMKDAGMKTSVCLSRTDNLASVHRCHGFKQAFGSQTYELNLNTMLQSELKSKLIPTILDDSEINGLFVADPRSFELVIQILRSLHRLCSNKKAASSGRCIYFGTYGTDYQILQAVQKREIQFTIDPQEYLHGYLALTWMMLASNGFPIPPQANENSSFQFSRVIDSSEQAKLAMVMPKRLQSTSRFRTVLFGEATPNYLKELKRGLRNAARDFNVHVEFCHCMSGSESRGCVAIVENNNNSSHRLFDGYAFSNLGVFDEHILQRFESIVKSGKPYITFGEHHSFYSRPISALHIGHHQTTDLVHSDFVLDKSHEPALHGYLSVLLLTLNNRFGETPHGFLNTGNKSAHNIFFDYDLLVEI